VDAGAYLVSLYGLDRRIFVRATAAWIGRGSSRLDD
jgi:hypothetical protein